MIAIGCLQARQQGLALWTSPRLCNNSVYESRNTSALYGRTNSLLLKNDQLPGKNMFISVVCPL